MNRFKRIVGTLGTAAVLLTVAPASAEKIAIVGGTVHTLGSAGTLQQATVVIEDGQVTSVRRGTTVPDGARVIDAKGKVVTPGLFAPLSQLGLVEVSAVEPTVDNIQRGDTNTAGFDVADAYNPASTLVRVNRVEGVTRALVAPQASWPAEDGAKSRVISGSAAVVHLGDGADYLAVRKAAMVANLGSWGGSLAGGSRAGALLELTTALSDAIDYAQNRDAYERNARRPYSLSRNDLEALQPVLAGDIPLFVTADRASDIRVAIDMADQFGLNIVIVGGAEAWQVADRLVTSNTAVALSPFDNLPGSFDRLEATSHNARRLHEAGVRILFVTGDAHNERNLTQLAGNAVAFGLPWIEGLRAVTQTPAEVLGLGDKFGSLTAGMVADVVVWDGDPLEVTSYPDHVIIDGEEIDLVSRQTLLRDRYLDLDRTMPPAYFRPD